MSEQAERAAAEALASLDRAGGSGTSRVRADDQVVTGDQGTQELEATEGEKDGGAEDREFLEDPSGEEWSDEQDQDKEESSEDDEEKEGHAKNHVLSK